MSNMSTTIDTEYKRFKVACPVCGQVVFLLAQVDEDSDITQIDQSGTSYDTMKVCDNPDMRFICDKCTSIVSIETDADENEVIEIPWKKEVVNEDTPMSVSQQIQTSGQPSAFTQLEQLKNKK